MTPWLKKKKEKGEKKEKKVKKKTVKHSLVFIFIPTSWNVKMSDWQGKLSLASDLPRTLSAIRK